MAKYARKRSGKKSVNKSANAIVKKAKSLMLRSVETKFFYPSYAQLMANSAIYSYSPTQGLPVGNTANTRVGDQVLLSSLTVGGHFRILGSVLNAKMRILVGYSRNQTANTSLATGIIGATDLFYATGAIPNVDKVVNPAIFTCIYDEMWDINSNTTTGQDLRSFYARIPLKLKKFDYAASGGSLGKSTNLVVVCITESPSPSGGAGGTNGTIFLGVNMKFKDP